LDDATKVISKCIVDNDIVINNCAPPS
jgi:hypothetical protein